MVWQIKMNGANFRGVFFADSTFMVIEPCSKSGGGLTHILNATSGTGDHINDISRVTIKRMPNGKRGRCDMTFDKGIRNQKGRTRLTSTRTTRMGTKRARGDRMRKGGRLSFDHKIA